MMPVIRGKMRNPALGVRDETVNREVDKYFIELDKAVAWRSSYCETAGLKPPFRKCGPSTNIFYDDSVGNFDVTISNALPLFFVFFFVSIFL